MSASRNLCLLAIFIGFAVSAFAQIDGAAFASDLRAKYGPPLARETFTARPGIEMVVDYAANGHVCRIQLPPIGQSAEHGVLTAQAVDDFMAELLPVPMRGKELERGAETMGLVSISFVEYEYVTITEAFQALKRTGIAVTFAKEQCRDQPPQ